MSYTLEELRNIGADLRKDFPIINDSASYLDNSATSQKPRQVIEAVTYYYEESNANPLRGLYDLSVKATDAYEDAREAVRKFINAGKISEIVFTRNATESLNLIANSYGKAFLKEGDEILVSIMEHHSNMLPWQEVAKATGAKIKYLDIDENGAITVDVLSKAISKNTKLVAITQVSNVLGIKNDIKALAKLAHENGAIFVCDGAQSVPHMKVDVKELDVDFLAFSGHKMLAPMGIGVLYGKEELLEKMPPFLYGGAMIEYVTLEDTTYEELPHKFEAGTVNASGAVGLHAAIDYINKVGFDYIEERENQLTAYAFEKMKAIPHVNIVGSQNPADHHGILTFTVDGCHPHDISEIMNSLDVMVRAGHHCAQPLTKYLGLNSTTRASLGFYNNEKDIDRFIDALSQIRGKLGYGE